MRKKIVAIDMDDTICHLVPKAIHYHNLLYPDLPLTMEQMISFDMSGIWHPQCTEDIFFGRPGLYEELEIFDEYTVEEVRKIAAEHDVIIITAARPSSVAEKWNWLQRQMPFIPFENFFVAKRKYLLNFDLLIDDGPHNLLPAKAAGKQTIGIPRPWNKHVQDQFIMKDSWQGMSDLVNRLLTGQTSQG
ncbi:5' nucleotidase, NT5C type [Paenibacillus jiagnxiensis]|uniref:5' nucleotidase, NT5C type n=1 Tax=Paenibacillus jiagnxiensis TaxID=3228926 RepID=UPI0033BAE053